MDSIPRTHAGPAAVLFDDNESATYEDGEINDPSAMDQGPPSNQEQNRMITSGRSGSDAERREYVLSEFPETHSVPVSVPTASKRPWTPRTMSNVAQDNTAIIW